MDVLFSCFFAWICWVVVFSTIFWVPSQRQLIQSGGRNISERDNYLITPLRSSCRESIKLVWFFYRGIINLKYSFSSWNRKPLERKEPLCFKFNNQYHMMLNGSSVIMRIYSQGFAGRTWHSGHSPPRTPEWFSCSGFGSSCSSWEAVFNSASLV